MTLTKQISLPGVECDRIPAIFELDRPIGTQNKPIYHREETGTRIVPLSSSRVIKLVKIPKGASYYCDEFIREAEIMADLKHPNVVSTIKRVGYPLGGSDIGSCELGLIMERHPHTLDDYLFSDPKRITRFPFTLTVKQILTQLLSALAYLESKDISHRDIKENNVLLSKTGTLILTDFGFATRNRRPIKIASKGMGSIYASPQELIFQRDYKIYHKPFPNGQRADQWAVGVILLHLVLKEVPKTVNDLERVYHEAPESELNNLSFPEMVSSWTDTQVARIDPGHPYLPVIQQLLDFGKVGPPTYSMQALADQISTLPDFPVQPGIWRQKYDVVVESRANDIVVVQPSLPTPSQESSRDLSVNSSYISTLAPAPEDVSNWRTQCGNCCIAIGVAIQGPQRPQIQPIETVSQ